MHRVRPVSLRDGAIRCRECPNCLTVIKAGRHVIHRLVEIRDDPSFGVRDELVAGWNEAVRDNPCTGLDKCDE